MARPTSKVPKMEKASEQMRFFAAALEAELLTWPAVTAKPMFGMSGIYRGKSIFAALPKSRALWTPTSIGMKLPGASDDLMKRMKADKRFAVRSERLNKWVAFELNEERDLTAALQWLSEAYELAKPTSAQKKAVRKKTRR